MENDFISRQAAIRIVCDDECEDCPDGGCDMYRRLKRLPAADVRPVARAKWDVVEKPLEKATICECSECKNRIWMYDGDDGWNFCPNCGADMREDGTDG